MDRLSSLWRDNRIAVVVAAALVLTVAILAAQAAGPLVSFEAEGANLSGAVLTKSDATASGGKYIEFGGSSSGAAVSIQGKDFYINGQIVNAGSQAEGQLMNLRTVQAAFDDENSATVNDFKYPDTGKWDAERNVNEYLAFIPTMAGKGLNAVTIGMQGGNPYTAGAGTIVHNEKVSAFTSNGGIKSAWKTRLEKVIEKLDDNGMVAVLSLFYNHQADELANEAAVKAAVDNTVDWLLAKGYDNVMIEIANESGTSSMWHAIQRSNRVHELISRAKTRSGGKFPTSVSYLGNTSVIPSDAVVAAADYVTVHGNQIDSDSAFNNYINTIQNKAGNKPVVVNEDTHISHFDDAINQGISWGYHITGSKNDYSYGYQGPPVKWAINDSVKSTFFNQVEQFTSGSTTPPPPPPTSGGAFIEKNGVVVMEVESMPTTGLWKSGTGFGAIGSYYWSDRPIGGITVPGNGTLSYTIKINEPGVYIATVRARRDRTASETCSNPANFPDAQCVENGERNDIFIRMDGVPWHTKNHKGTTHAGFGTWGWVDKWREAEDNSGSCPLPGKACNFRAFHWNLSAGLHTLDISERAEQLKIDRIILYRSDTDPFNLASIRSQRPAATTPESARQ